MAVNREPSSLLITLVIPLVSAFAAVAAVAFAALAWRGSEEANRIARLALESGKEANQLANSAHIDFDIDPYSDDPQVGFAIRSTGHGTAVVGEIEYIVDDRGPTDLDGALMAASLDPDVNHGWYIEPGYLMAPGEVAWLLDYHSKDRAVNERLADLLDRLTIRVNYCTVTHECAISCFPDRTCAAHAARTPVAPKVAAIENVNAKTTPPSAQHRKHHKKASAASNSAR